MMARFIPLYGTTLRIETRGRFLKRKVRQVIWWGAMVGISAFILSWAIPSYFGAIQFVGAMIKADR